MKINSEWILGLLGAVILGVLGFIGATVWEGVQIAEQNQVKLEMMREDQKEMKGEQKEMRGDVKELRRELYAVYPVMSDIAEGANIGTGVE